jgi:hypothetical protein
MIEFHEVWIEQCEAARDIREAFGLQKTLGYAIGGKLLDFLRADDEDPAFAGELPRFVAEITQIFAARRSRATLTACTGWARSGTSPVTRSTRRCARPARLTRIWSSGRRRSC